MGPEYRRDASWVLDHRELYLSGIFINFKYKQKPLKGRKAIISEDDSALIGPSDNSSVAQPQFGFSHVAIHMPHVVPSHPSRKTYLGYHAKLGKQVPACIGSFWSVGLETVALSS